MSFAAVFFWHAFLRHGNQFEVRRLFPNHQTIIAPRFAGRAIEQIAHLNPTGSVLLRFEPANRIERAGLEFHPADIRLDVIELLFIDQQQRVRRRTQPLRKHFHPPNIALLRIKGVPIHIARRIELPRDFARRLQRLRDFGLVIVVALRFARPCIRVSGG